jgi:hypothetical protein
LAFAETLQAIGQAGVSSAEAKFLRRRAVEVFAAAAAAGPPQPGYALVAFEELRTGLAAERGHPVGLGRLRRWLLAAGRPDLVNRIQAMARCRRWTAHPDVELVGEVLQVARTCPGDSGDTTAEFLNLYEDEHTEGSGDEWAIASVSSDGYAAAGAVGNGVPGRRSAVQPRTEFVNLEYKKMVASESLHENVLGDSSAVQPMSEFVDLEYKELAASESLHENELGDIGGAVPCGLMVVGQCEDFFIGEVGISLGTQTEIDELGNRLSEAPRVHTSGVWHAGAQAHGLRAACRRRRQLAGCSPEKAEGKAKPGKVAWADAEGDGDDGDQGPWGLAAAGCEVLDEFDVDEAFEVDEDEKKIEGQRQVQDQQRQPQPHQQHRQRQHRKRQQKQQQQQQPLQPLDVEGIPEETAGRIRMARHGFPDSSSEVESGWRGMASPIHPARLNQDGAADETKKVLKKDEKSIGGDKSIGTKKAFEEVLKEDVKSIGGEKSIGGDKSIGGEKAFEEMLKKDEESIGDEMSTGDENFEEVLKEDVRSIGGDKSIRGEKSIGDFCDLKLCENKKSIGGDKSSVGKDTVWAALAAAVEVANRHVAEVHEKSGEVVVGKNRRRGRHQG